MDAVEFLKEAKRYCKWCKKTTQYGKKRLCDVCYFEKLNDIFNLHPMAYHKFVETVEQWAKAHPIKTRQSEFLKMWPDAEIGDDGHPSVDPCQLHKEMANVEVHDGYCNKYGCDECRRDFWLTEISEGKACE